MHSDKRNSIMGLDFFTVQHCFVRRRAFSPTAEAPMLGSTKVYLCSPWCSIPFSLTAKVMICGTCIMASVRDLGKCGISRGVSYTILACTAIQIVLEMKCSDTVV